MERPFLLERHRTMTGEFSQYVEAPSEEDAVPVLHLCGVHEHLPPTPI
jgi:hypothetical protein